ncbi:Hypothetical protein NTJ_12738 [Nesidiocoris tenuis]|uniref:Uncharacterized protein n=1 Tax=Nesidiocoris tenuis TaxID=355587 RepID=A0ABN7B698_9HEMI|nr:Hypothetical protein NTJ_12738 [Nesidiocoris tenuis]
MNHPDYLRRRLSQCLEADEEEDDDSTATGPTSSASSDAGGTSRQPSRPSSSASGSTTSSIRRHVSPKWVDTSLPPLRAPAPALISTLEPGDIWLQRASQVKVTIR